MRINILKLSLVKCKSVLFGDERLSTDGHYHDVHCGVGRIIETPDACDKRPYLINTLIPGTRRSARPGWGIPRPLTQSFLVPFVGALTNAVYRHSDGHENG